MTAPRNDDERFADWVDDRLPTDEREQLERELLSDPELRERLAAYESAAGFVRSEGGDERAPAGLADSIMAAVEAENAPLPGLRRWLPVLSSVAAAAAMVTLGVFLWSLSAGSPARQDTAILGPVTARGEMDRAHSADDKLGLVSDTSEVRGAPEDELFGVSTVPDGDLGRPVEKARFLKARVDVVGEPGSAEQAPAPTTVATGRTLYFADRARGAEPLEQAQEIVRKSSKEQEVLGRGLRPEDELGSPVVTGAEAYQVKDGALPQLGFGAEGAPSRARRSGDASTVDTANGSIGSLLVLLTVPPPSSAPDPSTGAGEKVAQRRLANRREAAAQLAEADPVLSLVQPGELPPGEPSWTVRELAPVFAPGRPEATNRQATKSAEAPFVVVAGDRVFSVTAGPAQLVSYFSRLRQAVDQRGGKVELRRVPTPSIGYLGGLASSGRRSAELGLQSVSGDSVLVVVRSEPKQPASPDARIQSRAKAKK